MLPTISRTPARILLVDDHGVFRQALVSLLTNRLEVAEVKPCASGTEAVALAQSWRPDIVLMDVVMPGVSGIDAAREIRRLPSPPRVIMFAGYGDEEMVVAALRAGASGYVLKECDVDELILAISVIMQGGLYVSSRLSENTDLVALVERARSERHASPVDVLTPREQQILRLIADGYTSRGIASLLHVSPKTVESHRERLMTKLGLHNKVQLTRFALRQGLAPLNEAGPSAWTTPPDAPLTAAAVGAGSAATPAA